jgi:hypothetical protein
MAFHARSKRCSDCLTRFPCAESYRRGKAVVGVRRRKRLQTNQKVLRITGVTNFWPGLISVLTTLWVAISSRFGLVFTRSVEVRIARLPRRGSRRGLSLIRYRSASLMAGCSLYRLAPPWWCSTQVFGRSEAHRGRSSEHRVRSFPGFDPPPDISFRTETPRPPWRSVGPIV